MNDPRTFQDLWDWAVEQGELADNPPPIRLHDEDRGENFKRPVLTGLESYGGQPFSFQFEQWTEGMPPTPVEKALRSMGRRGRPQTLEFRIASGVVLNRFTDPEMLRAILGPSMSDFRLAAMRGLRCLYELTQNHEANLLERVRGKSLDDSVRLVVTRSVAEAGRTQDARASSDRKKRTRPIGIVGVRP